MAAVVHEIIYAIAFPLARGESLSPDTPTVRLLAHGLVGLAVAPGAARALRAARPAGPA